MPTHALVAIGRRDSILSDRLGVRLGRPAYDHGGRMECSELPRSS